MVRTVELTEDDFSRLYESYYKHAFIAAHDIITDYGECEDIVQEAFTRCFLKMQDGQEITGFGSYIQKTAKNIAKDHIKAREAQKRPDEVLTSYSNESDDTDEERELYDAERSEIQEALRKAADFYQTPEEHFEEAEVQEFVQEILEELPEYQREALSLFYLEGMKYREISEIYGVSVDTIKSRVNQGKKKVEKKVIELEKTKGIKLRGLAPFVFFFVLLRQSSVAKAAELSATGYPMISAKIAAGTKKNVVDILREALQKFFAKSYTVAGKTISGKAIALITAGTVTGCGMIGGAICYQQAKDAVEPVELVEQTGDVVQNEEGTLDQGDSTQEDPVQEEPVEDSTVTTVEPMTGFSTEEDAEVTNQNQDQSQDWDQESTEFDETTDEVGVYTSETVPISHMGISGGFRDAAGNEMHVSYSTDPEEGSKIIGNLTIAYTGGTIEQYKGSRYLAYYEESTNIYRLTYDSYGVVDDYQDTAFQIAYDNGGNTVRLYENGRLVDTYSRYEGPYES